MPTRQALDLALRYNRTIAGLEASTIERLNAAMDRAYRDLERELRRTYPAIASNQSLFVTQRKVLILEQLGETLQLVRPDQAAFYQQTLQETLQTANELGRTLADELISATNPNQAVAALSNVNIEAAALQARDGADRLRRYSEEFRGRASAIVEQGLIQGWGPARVADLMRRELGTTKSKAETLARTEVLSALNDASQQRYTENGLQYFQWLATPSEASCKYCINRNMQVFKLGTRIPAHPRCLPAGVVVSAPSVLASTGREYLGEVVCIETAGGKKLTATPNHPVLTPQGWVSVDALNEGDYVFSCLDSERVTSAIAPNDYNRPTVVEEIFRAFSESSCMTTSRVEVTPEDFHGDGEGSEVCVISTDRELWRQVHSKTDEHRLKLPLKWGLVRKLGLLADRLPAFLLPGECSTSTCSMCGRKLPRPLGISHFLPLQQLSLRLRADRNLRILQDSPDGRTLHTKGLSNNLLRNSGLVKLNNLIPNLRVSLSKPLSRFAALDLLVGFRRSLQSSLFQGSSQDVGIEMIEPSRILNRFPSLIFQDRIVKTSRTHFSGHVYNLETVTEWYFANDILTHNCRCIPLPWDKRWQDIGLADEDFAKEYRDRLIDDADKLGVKPDSGVTPFEKYAGLTKAPKPFWSPDK